MSQLKMMADRDGKISLSDSMVEIQGGRVCFVAEDGRRMFEVRPGKDGRSLEIRGVDTCKVDGVLYRNTLSIEPDVSNAVTVRTVPYGK